MRPLTPGLDFAPGWDVSPVGKRGVVRVALYERMVAKGKPKKVAGRTAVQ